MYKNMIISFLGALLLRNTLGTTDAGEQIAIIVGWAAMLFIFCIFCEEQLEKWQKREKRILEMERRLEELKGGRADEGRENTASYDTAGDGTGYAADDAG